MYLMMGVIQNLMKCGMCTTLGCADMASACQEFSVKGKDQTVLVAIQIKQNIRRIPWQSSG